MNWRGGNQLAGLPIGRQPPKPWPWPNLTVRIPQRDGLDLFLTSKPSNTGNNNACILAEQNILASKYLTSFSKHHRLATLFSTYTVCFKETKQATQ